MRAMADKADARQRLAAAGVPVLPGYDGMAQDRATLRREAARIGWPLMVKAAAGGGGRGMRLVERAGDLDAALDSAASEAAAAFADARLLLERAVADARHVEIQVFADAHGNVIHLGERDCSVQRRHQKLVEEAPSPAVAPALRRRMGEVAVAVAREVGYRGAGTVEFLLDAAGDFWFIEMNTRLQVEHAVTEALLGVDLVEWQLRVAAGEPLPLTQEEALGRYEAGGHAIEVRLCAEDPARGYLPQAGRIVRWSAPPLRALRSRAGRAARSSAASTTRCSASSSPTRRRATAPSHSWPRRSIAPSASASPATALSSRGCCATRAFVAGAATTSFLPVNFPDDASRRATAHSWLEALAAGALAVLPRDHLPASWAGWSSSPALSRDVAARRRRGHSPLASRRHARHLRRAQRRRQPPHRRDPGTPSQRPRRRDRRERRRPTGPRDLRPCRRHELVARRRRRDHSHRRTAAQPRECSRVRAGEPARADAWPRHAGTGRGWQRSRSWRVAHGAGSDEDGAPDPRSARRHRRRAAREGWRSGRGAAMSRRDGGAMMRWGRPSGGGSGRRCALLRSCPPARARYGSRLLLYFAPQNAPSPRSRTERLALSLARPGSASESPASAART